MQALHLPQRIASQGWAEPLAGEGLEPAHPSPPRPLALGELPLPPGSYWWG